MFTAAGDMSLVGPRPRIREEIASSRVGSEAATWWRQHDRTWQILGSSRVPVSDMVTIATCTAPNWSPGVPKILARTSPTFSAAAAGTRRPLARRVADRAPCGGAGVSNGSNHCGRAVFRLCHVAVRRLAACLDWCVLRHQGGQLPTELPRRCPPTGFCHSAATTMTEATADPDPRCRRYRRRPGARWLAQRGGPQRAASRPTRSRAARSAGGGGGRMLSLPRRSARGHHARTGVQRGHLCRRRSRPEPGVVERRRTITPSTLPAATPIGHVGYLVLSNTSMLRRSEPRSSPPSRALG